MRRDPQQKRRFDRSWVLPTTTATAIMPSFTAIAAPLSDLTKMGLPESVRWEDAQEKAFVTLRESLVRRPIVRLPDHNKTFILGTDASNCGRWAALMQEHEGRFFPIAYESKKLTSAERKYSTFEKECLAIVWGV